LPSVSGADNLGNHTATTNLNMSLKDILACNKIRVDEVDLGTCKLKTTFQGASITASGGAALFVNGVPSSTSHKIYVYGSAYADGGTWQASDKNFKRNIEQLSTMKSKLFSIQPYSYYFKQEEFPERGFDNNIHYGFIAQDVEKIFPTMAKKEAGHYAINYTEFIPLLLQALKEEDAQVQQQQQTINQLQSKLAALNNNMEEVNAQKARINELENKLAALQANMDVCCQSKNATQTDGKTTVITKSTLQQNTPNPFSKETRIAFNIVGKYQKAFIGIYNLNGEQVDKIFIEQGSDSINVLAGQLKPGMYVYSLVVDNDLVDSKKMVIIE
jgi:polyhydroxyalkanoate synthesis regulator phasin